VVAALAGFPGAPTGRGEDARMTALALEKAGVPYAVIDRGDERGGRQDPPLHADIVISHFNAETALTDHAWLAASAVRAGWRIGYWAWELSSFPDEWLYAFGVYDEIWASTEFARDAFASRSPRPVHLMPMVVDLPPLDGAEDTLVRRVRFGLPKDRYLFFMSFDFRSFVARKNPQAAIRAFQAAFPTVALRLHVEALGAVAAMVIDQAAVIGISGPFVTGVADLDSCLAGSTVLVPVASPDHPLGSMTQIAPGAGRDYTQLVLSDRSSFTTGQDFAVISAKTWRLADLGAKHALLKEGIGWGNMPLPMVVDDLAAGRLVRLAMPDFTGGIFRFAGIWRRDTPPGPAARWLLDQFTALGLSDGDGDHLADV
jgi:hypothetical protein